MGSGIPFVERDSKLKVKTIRGTAVSDEEEGQGMPGSFRAGPYGETCCMVRLSLQVTHSPASLGQPPWAMAHRC